VEKWLEGRGGMGGADNIREQMRFLLCTKKQQRTDVIFGGYQMDGTVLTVPQMCTDRRGRARGSFLFLHLRRKLVDSLRPFRLLFWI
jgi:hypothetical protein